jgi:hypothetical protein
LKQCLQSTALLLIHDGFYAAPHPIEVNTH